MGIVLAEIVYGFDERKELLGPISLANPLFSDYTDCYSMTRS